MRFLKAFVYSLFLLCATFCIGQAVPVSIVPTPQFQGFDANGRPLAFGCVFTYSSGTTNQLTTYSDYTGTIPNPNPVPLSASGSANIWLQAGQLYTIIVKSNGGTDCSLGTQMYSVDGVSGGGTAQTATVIPSGPTPSFPVIAQLQLFTITLTQNTVSLPVTFVNVQAPAIVSFQIIEDSTGGWTFGWPANTVGGATVDATANHTTVQSFMYDGTSVVAMGPATYSDGSLAALNLYDFGLTASLPVCTSATFLLTSTCTGLIPNSALTHSSVTYNGQAVALGAAGNVNAGAAAHSVAINEGAAAAIAGVALTDDQLAVGRTGADPSATNIVNCALGLNYNTSTHAFGCATGPLILASVTLATCNLVPNGGEWNCGATVNWGVTLPSSTYKALCQLSEPMPDGSYAPPNGYDAKVFLKDGTRTTTSIDYVINDDHSGSNGAGYKLWCIATQ